MYVITMRLSIVKVKYLSTDSNIAMRREPGAKEPLLWLPQSTKPFTCTTVASVF